MAQTALKTDVREARIFRNSKIQVIPIPADFELDRTTVRIRRAGQRLIIEPVDKMSIIEVLSKLEPLGPEDEFPETDEGLLPLKDIEL